MAKNDHSYVLNKYEFPKFVWNYNKYLIDTSGVFLLLVSLKTIDMLKICMYVHTNFIVYLNVEQRIIFTFHYHDRNKNHIQLQIAYEFFSENKIL